VFALDLLRGFLAGAARCGSVRQFLGAFRFLAAPFVDLLAGLVNGRQLAAVDLGQALPNVGHFEIEATGQSVNVSGGVKDHKIATADSKGQAFLFQRGRKTLRVVGGGP